MVKYEKLSKSEESEIRNDIAHGLVQYFYPVLLVLLAVILLVYAIKGIPFQSYINGVIIFFLSLWGYFRWAKREPLKSAYAVIILFAIGMIGQAITFNSPRSIGALLFGANTLIWAGLFLRRWQAWFFNIFLSGIVITITILLNNGTIVEGQPYFSYTLSAIAIIIGNTVILLTILPISNRFFQMILELNKRLREIEEIRAFNEQAVNSSHELFYWLTPDGCLQFANNTALQLINTPMKAVRNKLFWETPWFSHDFNVKQQLISAIEAVKNTQDPMRYNTYYVSADGNKRDVDFRLCPIFTTEGILTQIVAEGIDITEELHTKLREEKLQEQLFQSQKLDAVGQLAGGIAHDFNNALGGIIGAVELIRDEDNLSNTQQEYIELVLNAANRAGSLTKKLLAFSRKSAKVSTAVNCSDIVNETVSLLQRTIDRSITINFENQAENSAIIGDDSLLQSAFMNMGINASHAMPDGGVLTYTLRNIVLDEEYCNVSTFAIKPGNYLEVSIRDTGTGMSRDTLSHIFEPFFTTKEEGKGTGLGLAAVYGAVQEHNGAITVYSEVGRGTVFYIYLPVESEAEILPKVYEEAVLSGKGTILVVDDEELIRITAAAMLKSLGYTVLLAENGQDGIELFKKKKSEIDLIILDMIMPVLGGRDTFLQIRKISASVPVLISSGFTKEEDLVALKNQGVLGFLHKPFRKAELGERVRNVIKNENEKTEISS